ACLARGRQHGYPNPVERKYPRPAAARLDLAFDDVEDRVHDLERLARLALAGAGEFLRGPIEPCRDLRFEPAGLAENVHGQFIFTSPASAAAATISPAAGAA